MTGCKKSDCELIDDHVHLYTKKRYVKYMHSKILSDWGWKWNEEYHYLNHKDKELQKFLDKNDLIIIEDNQSNYQISK